MLPADNVDDLPSDEPGLGGGEKGDHGRGVRRLPDPPSQVMVAWPDTSRSPAVAAFVRTAFEVASHQTMSPNGWAHAAHTPGAL